MRLAKFKLQLVHVYHIWLFWNLRFGGHAISSLVINNQNVTVYLNFFDWVYVWNVLIYIVYESVGHKSFTFIHVTYMYIVSRTNKTR